MTSSEAPSLPSLRAGKPEGDEGGAAKAKPRPKTLAKPIHPAAPSHAPGSHAAVDAARRTVAGGPAESVARETESPELAALREADEQLFRPSPTGSAPPWSSELSPSLTLDPTRPVIRASGLPPSGLVVENTSETGRDLGWLKMLTLPTLPVRWDARVVRYLDYYRGDVRGKNLVQSWVRKSGRYGAAMRRILEEQGLPDDLVWVALVESGFDPTVRSPAGAAGLWQLMPEGARAYGLVVDRWIDERLDVERSTEAAVRYLSDLHRRFGAWELALAAYNMGYGGLLTAIRKYNTNDYWELSKLESGIPYETALYVPKIIALSVASKNAATFGLESVKVDAPVLFDSIQVPSGVTTRTVAAAAGVDSSVIEALNPQLRAGRTPPEAPSSEAVTWNVRVPAGKGQATTQSLIERSQQDRRLARYVAKLGDSVDSIALSRGTTKTRLQELNGLRADEAVRPGTVLVMPPAEAARSAPVPATEDKPVVVVPADTPEYAGQKRVFYRVVAGDSLQEIARAFRVTPDDVKRWNALDPSARLHEGMTFQIFVDKAADLSKIACLGEPDVRCITVGSDDFFSYFESQKNRKRTTIAVEEGDTWEKLAKRFNLTVGQLERINQRSRTEKLAPKETLVVYAPVGRSVTHQVASSTQASPAPLDAVVAPNPDDLPALPDREPVSGPSVTGPATVTAP